KVRDNEGVGTVTLYYKPIGGVDTAVTMELTGVADTYQGTISVADNKVGEIGYYIQAVDKVGKSARNPEVNGVYYGVTVIDNDVPTAVISPASPIVVVQGETIYFDGSRSSDNVTSNVELSYSWEFGDGGIAGGMKPTHSYAAIGTYTGTLTVTDKAGNTNATSVTVRVNDNEVPVISEVSHIPGTGTTGESVVVSAKVRDNEGVGTVTLYYKPIDGVDTAVTMELTGVADTYQGTITVASNKVGEIRYYFKAVDNVGKTARMPDGEGIYYTVTIIDDDPPIAVFTHTPASPEQYQVVTFNAGSSTDNVKIESYYWRFGDGEVEFTNSIVDHAYKGKGSYTVILVVKDSAGHENTTQATITVRDIDLPTARITGRDKIVQEDTVVIFDGSESTDKSGIAKYIWNFGNGVEISTSTAIVSYSYPNPGVYVVGLNVVDNANNTSTVTAQISVTVTYMQLATQTTIGPAGGILGVEEDITLNIPNGALGENTMLKIEPSALSDVPSLFVGIAGATYKITPKKLFNKPVTLTIWYADADQNGLVDNCDINNPQNRPIVAVNLRVYYYDGYDWLMLPSTVNVASNSVSATVTNSGKFTLGLYDQGAAAKDVDPETILANLVLTQNPFAPTGGNFTEFQGDLGRDSYITIKIYDTTGEEIRELPKNLVTAGVSRLLSVWDGKTNGGEIAKNGIYVYQIKVEQVGGGTKVETHAIGIVK
ncbi:MAG: PKD domain-containing protein, partial [bacterium]|nr:PKD domain-containing protein [bacterium]